MHAQGSGSNGLAIASLVLGIIGLVTFWACGFGALPGLIAVVLGILGMQAANKQPGQPQRGLAIAGVVTGALAVLAGVAVFLLLVTADDDGVNSDPSNGVCNPERFIQDPDC